MNCTETAQPFLVLCEVLPAAAQHFGCLPSELRVGQPLDMEVTVMCNKVTCYVAANEPQTLPEHHLPLPFPCQELCIAIHSFWWWPSGNSLFYRQIEESGTTASAGQTGGGVVCPTSLFCLSHLLCFSRFLLEAFVLMVSLKTDFYSRNLQGICLGMRKSSTNCPALGGGWKCLMA